MSRPDASERPDVGERPGAGEEMGDPSMSDLERRLTSVPVELRTEGDKSKIAGYALK